MEQKSKPRFFLKIVFPSVLAITLFTIAIMAFLIPSIEKNTMERKKEMIRELTHTVYSLLEEYNTEYLDSNMTLEEAQTAAATKISHIRYGEENKDYFWIIDMHPNMIIHPYRNELNHSDLTQYKDPNGVKLFVQAVEIVKKDQEGFIDYMWQWKDDSTRIVPKLSYVKSYDTWGWIVGTGIYLEDVQKEIATIRSRLLRISFIILGIVAIILLFVVRSSLKIENNRRQAVDSLKLSKDKYKSLVAASTEGTLMVQEKKIIFSNNKLAALSGFTIDEIGGIAIEKLFQLDWDQVITSFTEHSRSVSIESFINCSDGISKEVILSISMLKQGSNFNYIIVAKEFSNEQLMEKEMDKLSQELQSSLMIMSQPIKPFVKDIVKCNTETTIFEAAALMNLKNRNAILIHKEGTIIGIVSDSDLSKRVIAKRLDPKNTVIEIMSSPVAGITDNTPFYKAKLQFKKKNVSHLAIRNSKGEINGIIGYKDTLEIQQNTIGFMIQEIENTQSVDEIIKIYNRIPVLVNALIQSGDKTHNTTAIISSITDAITNRIIHFGIEELGEVPCKFTFIVLGSEGRNEQSLCTDQDNAIIYENQSKDQELKAKEYFLKLGNFICDRLHKIGYKYCPGNNMASNPKWTASLNDWKRHFSNWIVNSEPQAVMETSIFVDFRSIYGEKQLTNELRNHVNTVCGNHASFFYHLSQSVLLFKAPSTILSKALSAGKNDDDRFLNLKNIMLPLVGFIRLYALQSKLQDTNSINRLNSLLEQGIISKTVHDEAFVSYNYLMYLRLRVQAESLLNNEKPDNIIDIHKLNHIELATLKNIVEELNNLISKIKWDFGENK